MAALVRVKRRRDEDQYETLVMACKRSKFDDNEIQSYLSFAGTAKTTNDCCRIARKALAMKKLDQTYPTDGLEQNELSVGNTSFTSGGYNIVSNVAAKNIEDLFSDRAMDASANQQLANYRLIDLENKKLDEGEDNVYDMYIADLKMHPSTFVVVSVGQYCPIIGDECDSEEEGLEKELEVQYFEENEDDERHWRADYPDENNVFYEKEGSSSEDDEDEKDAETEGGADALDYGDFLSDFGKVLTVSEEDKKNGEKLPKAAEEIQDA